MRSKNQSVGQSAPRSRPFRKLTTSCKRWARFPTDRNLNAVRLRFYCLINLSPDGALQAEASFRRWVRKFADGWEAWLNAAESAQGEGRSALQSGKADRARDQRPVRSHSVP